MYRKRVGGRTRARRMKRERREQGRERELGQGASKRGS